MPPPQPSGEARPHQPAGTSAPGAWARASNARAWPHELRNLAIEKAPWRVGAIVAAVVVALALLLVARRPLAQWLWPETRIEELRAGAAQALARGHLTATDGSGARELYEAALALDPDRPEAREGLGRVGRAALDGASRAMAAQRYQQAHRYLALARDLSVPRAQVELLSKQLREREAAIAGVERLLGEASRARDEGRLDGDNASALVLYQRVLALQPDNIRALEGREDTLADLLQQAGRALAAGKLVEAAEQVQAVRAADAGHVDLPDALAALAQATEQHRKAADVDLRRKQFAQARDGYRAVLSAEPEDAEAARGLALVATRYAQRSETAAADFKFDAAEAALRQAEEIAPEAPDTEQARQHLARARATYAKQSSQAQGAFTPRQRERRLQQLLADAQIAEGRGSLLVPPGDSAFDKVRAARALAPRDPRVRASSQRLLQAAVRCFEKELRDNRLGRAGECLDAWQTLAADTSGVRPAKRRLAQRWIEVGDERLGAGDLPVAKQALASARRLDPSAPGLDAFAQRINAVTAVRPP